jgi:PKD repeat protein
LGSHHRDGASTLRLDLRLNRGDLQWLLVGLKEWGSRSETNPSHGYTQTGSHTVTLTTAVGTEADTLTRSSYITVSARGCISPAAGFSGSPLTVSFSDASSGTISSRWWSFGDGGSSSETNPSHGYTQTGAYTVSLTVSGACGSDVLTRTNYITVSSGYTATSTTITYTYDSLNRLTNAAYSDGKGFTYAYNAHCPDGERVCYIGCPCRLRHPPGNHVTLKA